MQVSELTKNQTAAIERLQAEQKTQKNKEFARLVTEHLEKRCKEDPGFADDVMREGKTFGKCCSFIIMRAQKMAEANCAAVSDPQVYEWAEDYYRMTPEQEKKAKIPDAPKGAKVSVSKPAAAKEQPRPKNVPDKPAAQPKPEKPKAEGKKHPEQKKKNQVEGQLSLFDLL